ncbi:MAG TPA: efflux RND transporter periplasmic adaptor subunit, partial [Bacteroidales bacterium]|nr:efflux RND transporter periplasmic adaptor subunit [Bacteroidales bacterium]
MKTNININKKNLRNIAIAVVAGLMLGFVFFHNGENKTTGETNGQATHEHENESQIWTCSMHPQVRLDHPGKCPICGMDLIPLENLDKSEASFSAGIPMSEEAMKLADITTTEVKRAYPQKALQLLGKVKPDERNISELTARFGGRIEKLFVNFTGQKVRKGERLAVIYSPRLVSAQKELIEAWKTRESNPALYQAARNKLLVWDITDKQISKIEQSGEPQTYFDVLSPISGTVTMRHVAVGDYVKEGSALFRVVDLSRVWIMFEAYETDLPWLNVNDPVTFTVHSMPGKEFKGKISFIDPVLNPQTRIANVRVAVNNPNDELKPEMFADGMVHSSIAGKGEQLLIPKTALLWTGKRSVVYVKIPNTEEPRFEYREITIGPETGDNYVVESGLKEGEEIAVNGVFSIDASAQLSGKVSMMNPEGTKASAGHNHGQMNMGNQTGQSAVATEPLKQEQAEIQKVNLAFMNQLTAVYNKYLAMKDAFVASDPSKVKKEAGKVSSTLKNVDMELLKGAQHMNWMDYLGTIKPGLEEIQSSGDIEVQRKAVIKVSHGMYEAVKAFGLSNEKAYYQFCPMANDNQGAYWLSANSE